MAKNEKTDAWLLSISFIYIEESGRSLLAHNAIIIKLYL